MTVSIKIIFIEKYFKFLNFTNNNNKWMDSSKLLGLVAIIWALGTSILKKTHVTVIYLNSTYRICI